MKSVLFFIIIFIFQFISISQNNKHSQCISGDCENGYGICRYNEGGIYRGNFVNGEASGYGESYKWQVIKGQYLNGTVYMNYTVYDPRGFIAITENGIQTYKGRRKAQPCNGNCYNGFGKKVEVDFEYEGNWVNGKPNGKGTIIWNTGHKYEGDIVNGSRTGSGIFTYAYGEKYEGAFLNNEFHGYGKYYYLEGDIYEGNWVNGQRTGTGIFIWQNGDKYDGNFIDDKRSGYGIYKFANNEIWEGNWDNGEFISGKKTFSDGTVINTTTSQTTSNTNNKVESTSSCQLKFSRITGMTYSFTDDNREKCCFCEKSYAKYSLNNSYQKDEEILLIGELLHLHLHDATEEHKKNDIERCQKFISDNFDFISAFAFTIMFELMGIHFMDSALKRGNFGQKHRKVNKYIFENKFCTNECESKCKYYGCSCK